MINLKLLIQLHFVIFMHKLLIKIINYLNLKFFEHEFFDHKELSLVLSIFLIYSLNILFNFYLYYFLIFFFLILGIFLLIIKNKLFYYYKIFFKIKYNLKIKESLIFIFLFTSYIYIFILKDFNLLMIFLIFCILYYFFIYIPFITKIIQDNIIIEIFEVLNVSCQLIISFYYIYCLFNIIKLSFIMIYLLIFFYFFSMGLNFYNNFRYIQDYIIFLSLLIFFNQFI